MKQPKKRILYSNYYSEKKYNSAKQSLIENSDDPNYEPSEKEIWDEVSFLEEMEWGDFRENFENFFNNIFVLQGTVGTWLGNLDGGYVFDTFDSLCHCWEDCDYVEIYDMNGRLYVNCSHHDGSNHYEIRMLTERGREYYNKHNYCMESRELHTKLMKNPYSVLPHAAHTVFGCKKIEWE